MGLIFAAIKLGTTDANMQSTKVIAETRTKVLMESNIGTVDII